MSVMRSVVRSALLVTAFTVGLAACGTKVDPSSTAPAQAAGPTSAPAAPAAPSAAPPDAADPGPAGESVQVKNPLGKTMAGTKVVDPPKGTAEATVLAALKHQAGNGSFDGFLGFMHPSAKQEPKQREQLKAYNYKSSKGNIAAQCLHDGGLITVARKSVEAGIAGGGDVGTKLMVWCGEGRMPVPFTLYPDGDVQRITVFGLN